MLAKKGTKSRRILSLSCGSSAKRIFKDTQRLLNALEVEAPFSCGNPQAYLIQKTEIRNSWPIRRRMNLFRTTKRARGNIVLPLAFGLEEINQGVYTATFWRGLMVCDRCTTCGIVTFCY